MDLQAIRERARCNVEARDVLGQTLRFRKLSLRDRDELAASIVDPNGKVTPASMVGYKARLVARTLMGDDDKPALTVEELETWAPEAVEALASAAESVNALAPSAVEDAAKN